jgi:hypothetical protein
MTAHKVLGSAAVLALAGCMHGAAPSIPGGTASATAGARTSPLTELANLNYSNGQITVFSVSGDKAKKTAAFTPAAQGLAMDAKGRIYTTITSSSAKPCSACVEVFTPTGHLIRRLNAPILKSASGAPSLTDVSVDQRWNVYVSDYGQQAVYYFPKGHSKKNPVVVVQNSSNAATVLATPNGSDVVVSGGCGFASVRPYARTSKGQYQSGSCFSIGTIALIGGAVDNSIDVMTPVDGALGLVSVSSPSGGNTFSTPDQQHAEISGAAYNGDASIAYVADHYCECVYAFGRPSNGWLSGQPTLLATYSGFKQLDIIAVPQ